MKNKLLKILLSVLIITQSMVFQVSAPRLVLCIGDEEHVAVEVSDGGHFAAENYHFNTLFASSGKQHHLIGDKCVDISLDYRFDRSHIGNKNSNIQLIAKNYFSLEQIEVNISDSPSFCEKIPSVNQHIATTILII